MELTTVLFGTEDGKLLIGGALLIEGQLWLVPAWLRSPDGKQRRPQIAIRLPMEAVFPAQTDPRFAYRLNGSVPKSALAGQSSALQGLEFEVVAAPPWTMDIPTNH